MAEFQADIPHVVRAMDNVIDRALYPLPEQEAEAKAKRRMGLGVTGVANALEAMGYTYGSDEFLDELDHILETLAYQCLKASVELAKEKGCFPKFNFLSYNANWIRKVFDLDTAQELVGDITKYGLRNSHLLSIAPTGTISLTADNISSGIEPVFAHEFNRTIITPNGPMVEAVSDYGFRVLGIKGKTADECTVKEHLDVLLLASNYVDSAVSKTCNIGADVSFDDFQQIYVDAWKGGAKGCTTFRASGKRQGILQTVAPQEGEGAACFIDPTTGQKTCA